MNIRISRGYIRIFPTSILIDKVSLDSFVKSSDKIYEISEGISHVAHCTISDSVFFLYEYVEKFHYLGIEFISEIEDLLNKYNDVIIKFADKWIEDDYDDKAVGLDISLFYLCYIVVAEKQSFDFAFNYFERFSIGENEDLNSRKLLGIYSKIKRGD